MKQGHELVEQVAKDGSPTMGYDESLSPTEIFECVAKYFPNIRKHPNNPRFLVGEYQGSKYALRCKNVTYLGSPHPRYKKRIQIPDDLQDFYSFAHSIGAKPFLLGIYSFGDNLVFVDFGIDTYIAKKAHNSSAHVYTSDLAAATEQRFFQKRDYFGNTVTAIRPDTVSAFLDDSFTSHAATREEMAGSRDAKEAPPRYSAASKIINEDIAPFVIDFFNEEKKEWRGAECYQAMIEVGYRNKFQPEWPGFFLEFEFERYLDEKSLHHLIRYAQDKTKGGVDLDLYFPTAESYGDLKAHSENSSGIQGNDWNTVFGIIGDPDKQGHIFYIVCEHSTEKDSEYDYEVTEFWNTAQGKSNLMSYASRMKNRIRLKRAYILDINYYNSEHLSQFKQGINSNGKPREPKIMINQDDLHYFVLEQIDL